MGRATWGGGWALQAQSWRRPRRWTRARRCVLGGGHQWVRVDELGGASEETVVNGMANHLCTLTPPMNAHKITLTHKHTHTQTRTHTP